MAKYDKTKKKTLRIGETSIASNGQKMTIVEYKKANDIIVEFEDGTKVKTRYQNFIKGMVKNPKMPTKKKKNVTPTTYNTTNTKSSDITKHVIEKAPQITTMKSTNKSLDAAKLFKSGRPTQEMCEILGVGKSTLYRLLQQEKISIIDVLKELMSFNRGWIPVEEKNPNKDGIYLVSLKNEEVITASCRVNNGNATWIYDSDSEVYAWMERPKPYLRMGKDEAKVILKKEKTKTNKKTASAIDIALEAMDENEKLKQLLSQYEKKEINHDKV